MTDESVTDDIAQLEAELERLADALDRCRKVALLSKLAMAAGAAWMLAWIVGLTGFDPSLMITAMAAVLGGFVAGGSNGTTTEQIEAAIKAAELRRAELIGMIDLRVVNAQRVLN
jgi:hypothetical protein